MANLPIPKPSRKAKKEKPGWFKFHISSNRGTNEHTYRYLTEEDGLTSKDVKAHLEDWASRFGAWHHSDNCINYSAQRVKIVPEEFLRKQIERKGRDLDYLRKELSHLASEMVRMHGKPTVEQSAKVKP